MNIINVVCSGNFRILNGNYEVDWIALPTNVKVDDDILEIFDPCTVSPPKTNGVLCCNVYVFEGREYVGFAHFGADENSIVCSGIDISKDHQRKGIATLIYDHAELVFNGVTKPSNTQFQGAVEFWKKRNARRGKV